MGLERVDCEFKSNYPRDRLVEIGSWFRNEKGLNIEYDRKSYTLKDEEPEVDESLKYSEEIKDLTENLNNIESVTTYKIDSFDLSNYLGRTLPQGHPQEYELTVVDNYTSAHMIGDKELTHPAKKIMKGEMNERKSNDPVTWIQDYVDNYIDNLEDDIDDFLDDLGL